MCMCIFHVDVHVCLCMHTFLVINIFSTTYCILIAPGSIYIPGCICTANNGDDTGHFGRGEAFFYLGMHGGGDITGESGRLEGSNRGVTGSSRHSLSILLLLILVPPTGGAAGSNVVFPCLFFFLFCFFSFLR